MFNKYKAKIAELETQLIEYKNLFSVLVKDSTFKIEAFKAKITELSDLNSNLYKKIQEVNAQLESKYMRNILNLEDFSLTASDMKKLTERSVEERRELLLKKAKKEIDIHMPEIESFIKQAALRGNTHIELCYLLDTIFKVNSALRYPGADILIEIFTNSGFRIESKNYVFWN